MLDAAILPLHSGYRDRSNLTLMFTTDYTRALDNLLAEVLKSQNESADEDLPRPSELEEEERNAVLEKIGQQMSVVIPLDDIASIRPYSLSLKESFDDYTQA